MFFEFTNKYNLGEYKSRLSNQKKSISKIRLAEDLKDLIMDDYEQINIYLRLSRLPARVSIAQIIQQVYSFKKNFQQHCSPKLHKNFLFLRFI